MVVLFFIPRTIQREQSRNASVNKTGFPEFSTELLPKKFLPAVSSFRNFKSYFSLWKFLTPIHARARCEKISLRPDCLTRLEQIYVDLSTQHAGCPVCLDVIDSPH